MGSTVCSDVNHACIVVYTDHEKPTMWVGCRAAEWVWGVCAHVCVWLGGWVGMCIMHDVS
jgi:hypothetical protein